MLSEYDRWKTIEPEDEKVKFEPDPEDIDRLREYEIEQRNKHLNK